MDCKGSHKQDIQEIILTADWPQFRKEINGKRTKTRDIQTIEETITYYTRAVQKATKKYIPNICKHKRQDRSKYYKMNKNQEQTQKTTSKTTHTRQQMKTKGHTLLTKNNTKWGRKLREYHTNVWE